jgi:hypothetical protein
MAEERERLEGGVRGWDADGERAGAGKKKGGKKGS